MKLTMPQTIQIPVGEIRKIFPDKTIWLYTGYVWEDIQELAFLPEIDVLVDGVFIQARKDNTLMWRGSAKPACH